MRKLTYLIEPECSGMEIRQYLKSEKGISSALLVKLKKYEDGICRNGIHARTIDHVFAGDILELHLREKPQMFTPLAVDVPILYDSEDVVVYNKPPYMPCHPSKNHLDDTLANVFAWYCQQNDFSASFRCINRLDRDTSGVVVVAKNRFSAAALTGNVEKEYVAIVTGIPTPESGTIEKPIYRPDPMRTERCVDERGQYAKTFYKTLLGGKKYAYVAFKLYTGRTHQIRVHMSWKGWPLAGDDMYGGKRDLFCRQALHCRSVTFKDPGSGKICEISAPLYPDMEEFLRGLESGKY